MAKTCKVRQLEADKKAKRQRQKRKGKKK